MRREFLGTLAAVAGLAAPQAVGLGFGTYAHRMLAWEDSLELIARTGYDGVELALMPGWPTEPGLLAGSARARVRGRLGDLGLGLPALLENLRAVGASSSTESGLDRVREAVGLGNDLSPGQPPILETVLGGSPGEWEQVRSQMVDRIGEWIRIAESGKTVICFKPHVGSAVNGIARSLWLMGQLDSPWFRCTYDYSHLWLAGDELVPSLKALLPACSYIHLKDATREGGRPRFLLPGDGTTDYAQLFRQAAGLGFRGFATVEVSAQLHRADGYEPIAVTRACYQRMAAAMAAAGLSRP